MKPIVVATDFSSSAESAMMYAAQLAKELKTSLLLLHTYQLPVTMTDMPVMMISTEELRNSTDNNLADAKRIIATSFPELPVEAEGRMGDLVDELKEVCRTREPIAVVLGRKTYKGLEKMLFGNTPLSVVRHLPYPVITVPEHAAAGMPRNAVLATDLSNVEDVPYHKITAIVNQLGARLHVLHVVHEESDTPGAKEHLLGGLAAATPVFHTVVAEDVTEGVQQYVNDNNIDLLLVLPHKHNLYERLFFKLHTEGLIDKVPVPVMCIQ